MSDKPATPDEVLDDLFTIGNLTDEQYRTVKRLRAENERLREELAEWTSAHAAVVELRGLVESHMDTARGEWQCVAEIRRLRAIETAARLLLRGMDLEHPDGWAAVQGLEDLRAALKQPRQGQSADEQAQPQIHLADHQQHDHHQQHQ